MEGCYLGDWMWLGTAVVHNGFGVEWEAEVLVSGCMKKRTSFIIVMSYDCEDRICGVE